MNEVLAAAGGKTHYVTETFASYIVVSSSIFYFPCLQLLILFQKKRSYEYHSTYVAIPSHAFETRPP